jgi:hypothetical protein
MPEITQADREAAKELMYRKWYGLSDAAYEEMFCQAFAAHRTAAAEAAKVEATNKAKVVKEIVAHVEAMIRVYATEYAGQEASGALEEIADDLPKALIEALGVTVEVGK